ncbi:hypothetical protein PoB_001502300 [Plakobranchus ocellatus]|uniref:Uncharacterized protein n=1 Tax=Plakobranchus ocellatus TaxID=259542 RepID=A0AAV3Z170_9GAST|nr:hypothetical protein PoB_001502300 [Plakobranchus ocellatus]
MNYLSYVLRPLLIFLPVCSLTRAVRVVRLIDPNLQLGVQLRGSSCIALEFRATCPLIGFCGEHDALELNIKTDPCQEPTSQFMVLSLSLARKGHC